MWRIQIIYLHNIFPAIQITVAFFILESVANAEKPDKCMASSIWASFSHAFYLLLSLHLSTYQN